MSTSSCIDRMSLLGSTVLDELALLRRLIVVVMMIRKLRSIIFDRVKAIEFFTGLSFLLNGFVIGHVFSVFGVRERCFGLGEHHDWLSLLKPGKVLSCHVVECEDQIRIGV